MIGLLYGTEKRPFSGFFMNEKFDNQTFYPNNNAIKIKRLCFYSDLQPEIIQYFSKKQKEMERIFFKKKVKTFKMNDKKILNVLIILFRLFVENKQS